MEENKPNLPAQLNLAPQQVTKQIVQTLFNGEMVRRNFKSIVQALAIPPDKSNLKEAQDRLKQGDALVNEMERVRKSISDPYFRAQKDIKGTFDEIMKPIIEEVAALRKLVLRADAENESEKRKAQAENQRISNIRQAMVDFINKATAYIGEATEEIQLTNIQKRIGTEKSRTNFYQELTEEFKAMCDPLTPLINNRKIIIKQGRSMKDEYDAAIKSDDIELASVLKGELEGLDSHMEENIMRIQETAFQQAVGMGAVVAEPLAETLKGRRLWKWRVDDIEKLYKKNPELVVKMPNKEAIDKLLSEKRADGSLDGVEELNINGLVLFIQKNI